MKSRSKITIYIDESGTLPDPKDKIVVLAAVGFDIDSKLQDLSKIVRKKLPPKQSSKLSEIKFYQTGERTKKIFLKELANSQIDIFALIVNKNNQSIVDTPDNYAVLAYFLLEECQIFYRDRIKEIIFDRHFHQISDQQKFNLEIKRLLGRNLKIQHLDSLSENSINIADMVAGSILWAYSGKDNQFYKQITDRIISEKILNWKEAKKLFLDKQNKPLD